MAALNRFEGWVLSSSLISVAIISASVPARAQASYASSYEVVEYKKATLGLLNLCPEPTKSTDHDADIATCKNIEPKLIALRTNHRVQKWKWADDRLNKHQALLHGRIMGHYFIKSGRRDQFACHHAETSWVNLHKISVDGRKNGEFFFKFRSPAHNLITLCRKEIGTPEWGAPLALGSPLPR